MYCIHSRVVVPKDAMRTSKGQLAGWLEFDGHCVYEYEYECVCVCEDGVVENRGEVCRL